MSGTTLAELAEAMAHKTLAMVKRYAHLTDGHAASVVARMTETFLAAQQPVVKVSRMREREIFRQIKAQNHRHTGVFRGFCNTEMAEKNRAQCDSPLATGW